MRRILILAAFGLSVATPLFAQDICSDTEAYRFGHEGRAIPNVCKDSARYGEEYERGAHDGRGAVLGAFMAGAIADDLLDDDDDFYFHTHNHRHDGWDHTHRHRHHMSQAGEFHGMHAGHHDHEMDFSGGHAGGGSHHHGR